MRARALIFVGVFAGFACAEVQGVVTGIVLDTRSGSLRPVLGIPGASPLGDPIPFPPGIVEAAIRNNSAVIVSAGQPSLVYLLRQLNSAAPEVIKLDSSIAAVSGIYLNGPATTALLYSSSNDLFQFVTGLDALPQLSDPIPASLMRGTF